MPPKGLSKFRKAKEHIKVAEGHYNNNKNADALAIINALMPQLRRWDDKSLLVEIHLLESKVYDAVHNLSKAKAALAASRTAANAVYVSPLQQAALDLQSGILGAEDKDFKTAFSYLYEAFEAYHQSATQNATQAAGQAETVAKSQELAQLALKYMLLCKIMANRADEVTQILAGKNAMKYQGRGVDAMRRVAKAFKARDLHEFKQVEAEYSDVFKADPLLNSQLDDLYEAMLEQHLLRTVEPYSQVQITHIASIVKLSPVDVERKLSQMILDKQLYGTIDQSNQCLIVYDDDADEDFEPALGTIEGMSKVIDALSENYTKAMAGDYDKKEDEKKSAKPEDVVKETGNAADDTHKKADADAVDPPKKGANDQTK